MGFRRVIIFHEGQDIPEKLTVLNFGREREAL